MKPPYPSLTAEWHNDTYDAICPSRPPLSVANKNVIVTGAGAGIGRESVKAYAMAGAAHISLLGRTLATLTQTKNIIETEFPSVRSSIYTVDVTDEAAMKKAAEGVGQWDILVLNAGITMKPSSIEHASVTEWWRVLEVCCFPSLSQLTTPDTPGIFRNASLLTHCRRQQTNVKGPMVAAHAFLPTRKNAAAIISVSAALVNLPASIPPSKGSSAYISSKMAQLKLLEHLAAENPDVFVISVHPGVVETNMMDIQEAKGMKVPLDNGTMVFDSIW